MSRFTMLMVKLTTGGVQTPFQVNKYYIPYFLSQSKCYSTIIFSLKILSKTTHFGLKLMMKSVLWQIFLKFLLTENYFFLLQKSEDLWQIFLKYLHTGNYSFLLQKSEDLCLNNKFSNKNHIITVITRSVKLSFWNVQHLYRILRK